MDGVTEVAKALLDKIQTRLANTPAGELPPQAAKYTASTLKDIRDLFEAQADKELKISVEIPEDLSDLAK